MLTKIKNFWNSLDGVTEISKRELFLEIVTAAMVGVVLGIIFSPKKDVMVGSNNSGNGCHCGNGYLSEKDKKEEKNKKDKKENV